MSGGPRCPHCREPAALNGRMQPVEGLSYDIYVLWCAGCESIIGHLWHTEMLRHFAERAVDMVLDGLVGPLEVVRSESRQAAPGDGAARPAQA